MYLQLMTFLFLVSIVIFIYFQIIRPLVKGTPLFPFFSPREKVEGDIEKEQESLDVLKKTKKLEELKEKHQKGA